jgi:hypothetical protein
MSAKAAGLLWFLVKGFHGSGQQFRRCQQRFCCLPSTFLGEGTEFLVPANPLMLGANSLILLG